ncbi:DnaA ATPase domain-containing protein [Streptomyces sp. 900105755]
MSSEEFTNDFIDSIWDGKGDSFRKRYREMDLPLVEDIEFLTANELAPQNLFLTFNATVMHADRKICADGRAPLQLQPCR